VCLASRGKAQWTNRDIRTYKKIIPPVNKIIAGSADHVINVYNGRGDK